MTAAPALWIATGPPLAGLGWLRAALAPQPAVWLPPHPLVPLLGVPDDHPAVRAAVQDWQRDSAAMLRAGSARLGHHRWLARRALDRPRDDRWLTSLCAPAGARTVVDPCPGLATAPAAALAPLGAALPRARVLLLLRAPLEHARALAAAGAPLPEAPGALLARWEAAFPGRVAVLFHHALQRQPQQALARVAALLGRPLPRPAPVIRTLRPPPPLPPATEAALAQAALATLGPLARHHPAEAARWAAQLQGALARGA